MMPNVVDGEEKERDKWRLRWQQLVELVAQDLCRTDDEVDEEAERIKAERLAEYNKKKAGKVKPAAKSIVTLDVKPWGKSFCLHWYMQKLT